MSTPVVSVLLPVYNGEKFIAQAVQSILDQTYQDFELIIIDDGSTDTTSVILDIFCDQRIKRLKNESNVGLVASLNRAAAVAQGTYLARMDADDISSPVRFARQVAFLEEHPEVGVLGTAAVQIDRRGRTISTLVMPETHELILWHFFFDLPILHPTVMMRRDLFNSLGGYDASFRHSEDMEMWSRLLFQIKFFNLREVLYTRRLHNASVGGTKSKTQIHLTTALRKKVLADVLGHEASYEVVRWFADPSHVLSVEDKKELMATFFRIYSYIIQTSDLGPENAQHIRDDLFRRMRIADHSNRRAVRKFVFRTLRDLLPMTTRHWFKSSRLGCFFVKRI